MRQVWVIRKNGVILWETRASCYDGAMHKLWVMVRITYVDGLIALGYEADVVPWKGRV